jgi:transposase-like protein
MRATRLQLHIFGNSTLVEQDHRRIKQRIRPMLGFKRFETAAVTRSAALSWRQKFANLHSTSNPSSENQPPLRKFGLRFWRREIGKVSPLTRTHP